MKALKQWFLDGQREFPWRENPSPYRVWVSEVMLQQTRAEVVVPYFERWMVRFPTIEELAGAPLDEVIKLWEGLGYYSRARNLHQGAQQLMRDFRGKLPDTQEELSKIKGIGPYTVGAILSFAFHKKVAAVDGNVIRVMSRYFRIEEDIAKLKTVQEIREQVTEFLPEDESWIVNEALIELGATICKPKKAKCHECPLQDTCRGFSEGVVDSLPYNSAKVKIEPLYRAVAVISCGDRLLVRRGQGGEIMSDLHEFPYFEVSPHGISEEHLSREIMQSLGLDVEYREALSRVKHTFTRYRVSLFPSHFVCHNREAVEGYQWLTREQLSRLAFSSGHRRIFHSFLQQPVAGLLPLV